MKFKELKEMYMRQYLVYNFKKKPKKPKTHANFQLLYKSSKKMCFKSFSNQFENLNYKYKKKIHYENSI